MSKQDKYRFNLRFDETDEDHRRVCEFLNACGRKKARYVVKAVLAYWDRTGETAVSKQKMTEEKPGKEAEEKEHFVNIDGDYTADRAEMSLMMRNYKMFNDIGKEE